MIVLVMSSRYEPFVSCGRSNWSPVLQVSTNIMNYDLAKQLSCRKANNFTNVKIMPVHIREGFTQVQLKFPEYIQSL